MLNMYLFLAADNELDIAAREDFSNEIQAAILSQKTAVFVQFDRRKQKIWEDNPNDFETKRYHISQTGVELIKTLKETNTGDPKVLHNFLNDCMQLDTKATHHVCVFWGHGGGFDATQDFKDESYRWLGVDYTSKDALSIYEINEAFTALPYQHDIIAFDACLMAVLEVAYVLRDNTNYMIASQAIEPSQGWQYKEAIDVLDVEHIQIDDVVVNQLMMSYTESSKRNNKSVTISAMRMSKVKQLVQKLDELAACLIKKYSYYFNVYELILLDVQRFKDKNYIDLKHFIELCQKFLKDSEVEERLEAVLIAFDAMIVQNYHSDEKYANANGVSILFPQTLTNGLPKNIAMYQDYPNWITLIELILKK